MNEVINNDPPNKNDEPDDDEPDDDEPDNPPVSVNTVGGEETKEEEESYESVDYSEGLSEQEDVKSELPNTERKLLELERIPPGKLDKPSSNSRRSTARTENVEIYNKIMQGWNGAKWLELGRLRKAQIAEEFLNERTIKKSGRNAKYKGTLVVRLPRDPLSFDITNLDSYSYAIGVNSNQAIRKLSAELSRDADQNKIKFTKISGEYTRELNQIGITSTGRGKNKTYYIAISTKKERKKEKDD